MNDESISSDDEFFLKPKKTSKIPGKNDLNTYSEREINEEKFIPKKEEKEKLKGKENIKENNEILKKEETKIQNLEIKENISDKKEENKISSGFNEIYSYLKIDYKNYFSEMNNDDYEYIQEIISSFDEKNGKGIKIEIINEIMIKFLEKISPNCYADPLFISKYFSKEICKLRKITKNKIEEYIDYFFSFRYDLLYSTNFCLNLKTLKYLGYILSYMFSKFHKYSIKDAKEFKKLLKLL